MSKKIFSAQDWENVPSEIQQAHTPSIVPIYNKVEDAIAAMNSGFSKEYEPNKDNVKAYDKLYKNFNYLCCPSAGLDPNSFTAE